MIRIVVVQLVLATLLLSGGCAGKGTANRFTSAYLAALDRYPGAPVRPEWIERFLEAYGHFDEPGLRRRVEAAYAPELYFNDTLHAIHDRDRLATYLSDTAARLEIMELKVLGRHLDGNDAWLRWTLHTRFRAGWREVDTTTPGMTHLRFNQAGKVVLHQDFWDSRQGIFEHLPVIGSLINWVRRRL